MGSGRHLAGPCSKDVNWMVDRARTAVSQAGSAATEGDQESVESKKMGLRRGCARLKPTPPRSFFHVLTAPLHLLSCMSATSPNTLVTDLHLLLLGFMNRNNYRTYGTPLTYEVATCVIEALLSTWSHAISWPRSTTLEPSRWDSQ